MVNILHMKTVSQRAMHDIKFKAESAGYKMSDVCRVAEIDQAQVSRWLNGITEPLYGSVIKLEQAADALISARLQVLNQAMEDAVK
jgi:transcriptional regulator with XRE-family HTH domain